MDYHVFCRDCGGELAAKLMTKPEVEDLGEVYRGLFLSVGRCESCEEKARINDEIAYN